METLQLSYAPNLTLTCYSTQGQMSDLEGADALLPYFKADMFLGDKALDADERVREPLRNAGITAVIPTKSNRPKPPP
jgi:hypothetical protein